MSSYSAQLNHPNAALYPRYGGAFPIVLAVTNMVIQVLTMSPLRAMTNNAGAAMEVFRTAYVSDEQESSQFLHNALRTEHT